MYHRWIDLSFYVGPNANRNAPKTCCPERYGKTTVGCLVHVIFWLKKHCIASKRQICISPAPLPSTHKVPHDNIGCSPISIVTRRVLQGASHLLHCRSSHSATNTAPSTHGKDADSMGWAVMSTDAPIPSHDTSTMHAYCFPLFLAPRLRAHQILLG